MRCNIFKWILCQVFTSICWTKMHLVYKEVNISCEFHYTFSKNKGLLFLLTVKFAVICVLGKWAECWRSHRGIVNSLSEVRRRSRHFRSTKQTNNRLWIQINGIKEWHSSKILMNMCKKCEKRMNNWEHVWSLDAGRSREVEVRGRTHD